jgi:hypothetical protein
MNPWEEILAHATHTICPECGVCFTPDAHDILIKRLVADNDRLLEALRYIAFCGPDQCEDIRFGIENKCLDQIYKSEAERTLWGDE